VSRVALTALAAAAAWLVCPPPSPGQAATAPAFSGVYRLVVSADPGCPASARVGPVSLAMQVTQAPVSAGAEVSGVPASPSESPDQGRFVLLRQGDRLHGAYGASTLELGLPTVEGTYRLWLQIMADGTAATASGGRARASGTGFGWFELSLATDPTGAPVGACPFALAHQWSLEPM
jgi:hypothetical protein